MGTGRVKGGLGHYKTEGGKREAGKRFKELGKEEGISKKKGGERGETNVSSCGYLDGCENFVQVLCIHRQGRAPENCYLSKRGYRLPWSESEKGRDPYSAFGREGKSGGCFDNGQNKNTGLNLFTGFCCKQRGVLRKRSSSS